MDNKPTKKRPTTREERYLAGAKSRHERWKRSTERRRGLETARVVARLLPPAALARYREMVGSYLGDNLDQVIRFALISWLHQQHAKNFGGSE